MAVEIQRRYSPEEYLALERRAEHRSEYVDGRIVPRALTNLPHVEITGNVLVALHSQFKGRPCEVFGSQMRVKVNATAMYAYPDVSAVSGKPHFEDTQKDTLLNPTLIVEVLSPSTEAYDRGDKFAHYLRLDSLQEYVMITQHKVCVEQYVRQENDWRFTALEDLDGTLRLPSVGCELPLREIYDRIEFPIHEGHEGLTR